MTIFCVSEAEAKRDKRCVLCLADKCLVSMCMAWRWVRTNVNDKPGEPLYESDNTYGYCGLAGPPWSGK